MKVLHKLVIAGSLITPAAAIVLPGIASAHTANIEVSCQTGINVDLTNYHGTDHVTVWKDGNVIADTDFTTEYHFHRGFTRTTSHTWHIKVAAGDEKSPDVSGTVPACVEESTTTSVATDVPPVPSSSTTTTLEPAVPTTPTTHPEIPCVLGPNGHYSFAGTDIPCEGAPTTTIAALIPPEVPSVPPTDTPPSGSLPATGSTSAPLVWLAIASFGLGCILLGTRRLWAR